MQENDELLQETEALFIQLCSDVVLEKAAYTDGRKRRKHNLAHSRINQIVRDICNDPDDAASFFTDLMQSEDCKVKLISAGYALANGCCTERARITLRALAQDADPDVAFHASMSLFVWEHQSENAAAD